MVNKKSIVKNELMKEIISIRIDTLWKMIVQKMENSLPDIDEEGATGKFDNKGAIFVPGGLVYQDSDEQNIRYETCEGMSGTDFRDRIRSSMRFDNATLLYPDGLHDLQYLRLDTLVIEKVKLFVTTFGIEFEKLRIPKRPGRVTTKSVGSAQLQQSTSGTVSSVYISCRG